MHQLIRSFVFIAFVVGSNSLFAGVVQPNDGPYYQLRGPRTLYIYDDSSREIMDEARAYNEAIRAIYDQSYGWKLDEEEDFILTSPRQQIANAYATVTPNLKTVWYPSGAAAIEEFAVSSWLSMLAVHETAHLYQMNAKGPWNSKLKKVLGNSFFTWPLGLIPIFVHPNQLLPSSFLEGNAVLNESRFNIGGRLHSGEKRALVLAQIAAGDIDASRLINNEFLFPYGEEAYLQGGYFQAHLAAKHGIEKTNRYFLAQGHHFIWPFKINATFREHFGSSFYQEVHEYLRSMQGLARNQKSAGVPPVLESIFVGPLNHDLERIFFLTTDGKETPVLHELVKSTGQWKSRQLDLPGGRVFFEGQKVLAASTEQRNSVSQEYSLYGEGAAYDPRFRGQIVTDWRADKVAALDAGSTWLEPRILVNGEFFDVGHSNAIIDDQGRVYYFRQNGAERIMYRDRQPLFKFDGFYGKPMEVAADGAVYFIANTDYGSTLYKWKSGEISRVLNSDRVIDARWIGGDRFLATEIGAKGHQVVIAKSESQAQVPATYSYAFASQSLIPSKVTDLNAIKTEERAYNSFRELRFSSLDIGAGFSTFSGLNSSFSVNFSDPLEYQSLQLLGNFSNKRTQALANYEFSKYLPNFFVNYLFDENTWIERSGREAKSPEQEISAGVKVPLFKWRRWDAVAALALNYKHKDLQNDPAIGFKLPDQEETFGTVSAASLRYSLEPGFGFLPWRKFSIDVRNKLETKPFKWTKRLNASSISTSYTHGFHREVYATLSGKAAWSERGDILVTGYESLSSDVRIDRLTTHNPEFYVKEATVARLELQKVFLTTLYDPRIPIGLSRTAPFLVGQAMFFDDSRYDNYPANTFEWGGGVELDLLLGHQLPFRYRTYVSYDTRNPQLAETRMQLSYRANF